MLSRRALFSLPVLGLVPSPQPEREVWLPPPLPLTRLLLGGDVMLSRGVGAMARKCNDPALPLRHLAPAIARADIRFVNLESPFSDRGRLVESGMVFKAEPEMIAALKLARITVVSTANNHARDCGGYGVEFTLDWLRRNGIAPAGSGVDEESAHEGAVVACHGTRYGFLAYTYDQNNGNRQDVDPRVAVMDVRRMHWDVVEMLGRADVVVVSMHAGQEYQPRPSARQMEFARAAIDAGARVVAGHHPHVTQTVEEYHGGVIFYSLGNLVFDQSPPETRRGLLAEVEFQGRALRGYRLTPVEIVNMTPEVRVPEQVG